VSQCVKCGQPLRFSVENALCWICWNKNDGGWKTATRWTAEQLEAERRREEEEKKK